MFGTSHTLHCAPASRKLCSLVICFPPLFHSVCRQPVQHRCQRWTNTECWETRWRCTPCTAAATYRCLHLCCARGPWHGDISAGRSCWHHYCSYDDMEPQNAEQMVSSEKYEAARSTSCDVCYPVVKLPLQIDRLWAPDAALLLWRLLFSEIRNRQHKIHTFPSVDTQHPYIPYHRNPHNMVTC